MHEAAVKREKKDDKKKASKAKEQAKAEGATEERRKSHFGFGGSKEKSTSTA